MSTVPENQSRKLRRKAHATGRHGATTRASRHLNTLERPHVTTIVALGVSGWYVTEIRPDISANEPVLWRVTIERYDQSMSITLTEADPDVALEELARYTAADAVSTRLTRIAEEARR